MFMFAGFGLKCLAVSNQRNGLYNLSKRSKCSSFMTSSRRLLQKNAAFMILLSSKMSPLLVEAEIVVCGTLWVNNEFLRDSEVIQRSIHCNQYSYPGSEVDNNRNDSRIIPNASECCILLQKSS